MAKLERYDAYRNAPASGRGTAARAPRSHWQETYAGPSLERPFHERGRRVGSVNYRLTVATTTLPRLTREGATVECGGSSGIATARNAAPWPHRRRPR
ncbi:hypothetical protein [Streptomyces sp. NPDC090036]|uniref:hypothetical protein n=1 Tax=Streptomyces sp. NPDC090036 TaxID=3365926 RepID=UPI0037FD0640